MKFDPTKPTSQMLGRFQPWHSGHTELFKKIHAETGQVIIMIRDTIIDKNNPYHKLEVKEKITSTLINEGFTFCIDFDIMVVPNITNIGYGRNVGYTMTKYKLDDDIEKISATDIRNAS
jgi:phosphopantetheine adenylyltransferase